MHSTTVPSSNNNGSILNKSILTFLQLKLMEIFKAFPAFQFKCFSKSVSEVLWKERECVLCSVALVAVVGWAFNEINDFPPTILSPLF